MVGDINLAALIFYSGKIVFTGAKNEYQIRKAYTSLIRVL
jgi:TATA-box binding protein (TBP) (component of TFIID and TFIIIB)